MPGTVTPTPVLDQFLDEISTAVREKNGTRLRDVLQLEPPLSPAYDQVISELDTHYVKGDDQALVTRCEQVVPPSGDGIGSSWSSFPDVLYKYFKFLRDVKPDDGDWVNLYEQLKVLLNQCIVALSDTTCGVIILPFVLYLSKVLAKVALGLDKQPQLVAHLLKDRGSGDGEGASERVTFVESSANVLREAFIKCLSDKTGSAGLAGLGRKGKPENKRTGIYMTANSCLKLLFQCRKLRNAQQMFVSIDAQSPLLSWYPSAQRVTYLYYLGRYMFANNHFYRAQLALQSAYDQCHARAQQQRTMILTYLIASNICLGRFPSSKLLLRKEASELAKRFLPICRAITKGHLAEFHSFLSLSNHTAQWFLRKRILFQLRSRCEMLVWRSLARRVFLISGYQGGEYNKVPFFRLGELQVGARWLLNREERSVLNEKSGNAQPVFGPGFGTQKGNEPKQNRFTNPRYIDPDFAGADEAIAETSFDVDTGTYGEDQGRDVVQAGITINGTNGSDNEEELSPTMAEVESIISSMIQQGLLRGFITHNNPRFAIPGAKARGALVVGFPNIWRAISKAADDDEVPGWVRDTEANSFRVGLPSGREPAAGMGGRVVNLSGARPAGAGA